MLTVCLAIKLPSRLREGIKGRAGSLLPFGYFNVGAE